MFNDDYSKPHARPRGALEVAIRARKQERALALMVADYQEKQSSRPDKKSKQNRGFLATFLANF